MMRSFGPLARSGSPLPMIAFALAVAACGTSGANKGASGSAMASAVDRSRCDDSGKQVVTADTNEDKKPDVWKMYVKGTQNGQTVQLMTCKQVDLNHDGTIDIVYHFDDAGLLSLEEFDLDFDGKFEMRSIYQGGKRTRQEKDMNFDGRPDIVGYYEGGKLVREESDANSDGRVDQWTYYDNGLVDRIGYDSTGSGRVDRWERGPDIGSAANPGATAAAPAAGAVPSPSPAPSGGAK